MVLIINDTFSRFEDVDLIPEAAKAVDSEIGETPEIREKSLRELKDKILAKENLQACLDDDFLLRFLRVAKFDVSKAYDRLINYYNSRRKYPQIFESFYPSSSVSCKGLRNFDAVPFRSADNSVIVIQRRGLFEPSRMVYEDVTRLDVLILEMLLENPITQKCGITAIIDFAGLSLQKVIYETPRRIRMCLDLFQNTFPLRFKSVHIVNAPVIFSLLYNATYPFLSKKMRSRVVVHSSRNGWKSLHSCLPPEILPEEYGGYLEQSDLIDLVEMVKTRELNFRDQMQYGFVRKNGKLP